MTRQSFCLQQCLVTFSIKCFITLHVEDQLMMLGQRQELLVHLKEAIHEVHHTYIPSAKDPIGYVECPLQHEEGCLPHVRLDDISEVNDILCSRSPGRIVPRKSYMLLLTTSKGKIAVSTILVPLNLTGNSSVTEASTQSTGNLNRILTQSKCDLLKFCCI